MTYREAAFEPQILYVNQKTYDDLAAAVAERDLMMRRRDERAMAYVPGSDVRTFYGWTRKRWVRERKRYNAQRGWKLPWREDIQARAGRGDAPWHLRNGNEARAVRIRLRDMPVEYDDSY